MIQISMNRPSTNWKLHELIQKDREEKEQNKLLDIGSCSFHIILGAFKSGAEKNGWDIKPIFKAAYTILHGTSVRTEDFISVTGEERYPLSFVKLSGWKVQLLQMDWLKFGKM